MWLGRVLWRGAVCEVWRDAEGHILGPGGRVLPCDQVQFLPPSLPTKIICVGRNYTEHAKELGNPVPERPLIFLKPPSAVLSHGGTIRIPPDSTQVEYEGEIAIVIARGFRNLGASEDPLEFVAGITPLNDVTARDLQRLDVQFTRGKSFDSFCPFGPWIAPVKGFGGITVTTFLNGAKVQEGRSDEMVFPIPELLRFISRVMTLCPGDVVATGTPPGVGRIAPGDKVSVQVGDIRLDNAVGI